MAKITEYNKIGPEYLADPAKCGSFRVEIPIDAATLFEALKDEDAWKAMLPIDRAEWHAPLGPETTRTIAAKDAEMLEQFFEWDEGRSFAFRLERGTVGILKAMAERYEVVPLTNKTSEIVITYRIQTKGLAAPLGPVLMIVFKVAGRKSMKKLSEYLQTRA
jgi:hypothetical protein